nr:hypothetical protein [Tanacetum cinerariifolium]
GDKKIMFEPDGDEVVWKNHYSQELIEWKFYDSCGVYSLMLGERFAIVFSWWFTLTTSWRFGELLDSDKMAKENVPALTRTDEQLVPVKARLPIGKRNLLMHLQKKQKNPIFSSQKDDKTGVCSFSLDKLCFNLNVDLLRIALEITHKDSTHPFVPPPAGDRIIDFAKGKTSDSDKPSTQLFKYYEAFSRELMGRHNIHRRPQFPVYLTADDYPLNNLKFVSKGGVDEVFRMHIHKDLITDAIQNSEYYKKYLEMATRKPRQPTTGIDEEGGKKKKALKADKESQPATKPQVEDDEYNLQRDSTNDADTVADMELSTSKVDTEILNVNEEHGKEVSHTVALEERIVELDEGQAGSHPEKRSAEFEQKHRLQEKINKALTSRIYKLENHDLYSKIDKQVNEVIKEAVHNTLQAPLSERFRDFTMQHDNNDELHESLATSHKRLCDDQDPPLPPPKDSDQSKKKKQDSDASASEYPLVQTSLACKTPDIRKAPSSSSKQNPASTS